MTRDELLVAITRCPEIDRARADCRHLCADIVGCQKAADFQAPEPWRGRIDTAPILFLSSNPSIADDDPFRASSRTDAEIIEYYQRSFDPDGPIGEKGYNSVAFWRGVRARAAEILGRDAVPGVDFALTELVHCKSRGEQGVSKAHLTCAGRWLDLVLGVSGASVVVLLGSKARDHCVARWKLDKGQSVHFGETIGGRRRAVVVLPHPNARGKRKVADCVSPEQLRQLRALVSGPD